MEEKITKIVELDIDFDNIELSDMGVEVISLVAEPAIEVDFMAFNEEQFVKPKGGETEDEFIGRCIPILIDEGKEQEQATAICYSYWDNKNFAANTEDEWSIDVEDTGCNVVNQFAKEEELTPEQQTILQWAEEHGEVITEDMYYIQDRQEFATVTDIKKTIQSLNILSKLGIKGNQTAEQRFKYTGPIAERRFCKGMLALNKMYSKQDLDLLEGKLSILNPGMGPRGRDSYNIFKYKGSVNCRHYWAELAVFKVDGKTIVIDRGPAAGLAGKSNNANSPSPTGAVRNNARYGFSILNEEQRIVAGPLMVPNQHILRRNENGEPYYVYFTKETIKKIRERFNREYKINNTDIEHDGNVKTDNILLEQWIIEHPQYDKSKYYGFFNLNLGTWFGVYKVNNNEDWNKIKSGELKGFSVAGNFTEKFSKVKHEDEKLLNRIIKILKSIQ